MVLLGANWRVVLTYIVYSLSSSSLPSWLKYVLPIALRGLTFVCVCIPAVSSSIYLLNQTPNSSGRDAISAGINSRGQVKIIKGEADSNQTELTRSVSARTFISRNAVFQIKIRIVLNFSSAFSVFCLW